MERIKNNHHRFLNRRHFLSSCAGSVGLTVSTRSVFAKSLNALILESKAGMNIPFMTFDLNGGAALPANFLVGSDGAAMNLLPSYNTIGWNPYTEGLFEGFGAPMAQDSSQLLAGILSVVSDEAASNFRMSTLCHEAASDVVNPMGIASLVQKSGLEGSLIKTGLSIKNSPSGGKNSFIFSENGSTPLFTENILTLINSSGFAPSIFPNFSNEQRSITVTEAQKLAELQLKTLGSSENESILKELSSEAYAKSVELAGNTPDVDPRQDQDAQEVFSIDGSTPSNDRRALLAAMTRNLMLGNVGPSVWTIDGCDYHDGTSTRGDSTDFQIGVDIGSAVEMAHRKQTPFMFQVVTDGGCEALLDTRKWTGDDNGKTLMVLGTYNPSKTPTVTQSQVGSFNDGQVADKSSLVGSPRTAGAAAFANYLNLCGRVNEFHTYLPDLFSGAGELDSILTFEPLEG